MGVKLKNKKKKRSLDDVSPEEGELPTVHPGRQGQAGVLSERRDDRGEDQSYEDKTGGKDDLRDGRKQPVTFIYLNP